MSIEKPSLEQKPEQSREEITAVLEAAVKEGRHVDLVIESKAGEACFTPDLIVEEFDGDYAMITYIAEDGEVGELIPLKISRVKKAELK